MGEQGEWARETVATLKAKGFDLTTVLTQDPRDNREPGVIVACSRCVVEGGGTLDSIAHRSGCPNEVPHA